MQTRTRLFGTKARMRGPSSLPRPSPAARQISNVARIENYFVSFVSSGMTSRASRAGAVRADHRTVSAASSSSLTGALRRECDCRHGQLSFSRSTVLAGLRSSRRESGKRASSFGLRWADCLRKAGRVRRHPNKLSRCAVWRDSRRARCVKRASTFGPILSKQP